ncbi:MAG: hypothetical protein IJX65_09530 [Alistipes sp.]|nr:hypothetical protein [Alistipes sp.]
MRKIFVLAVAALSYFCTYSQEAKASDNVPTLIISPRFEVNPYIRTGSEGYTGVDFGTSSLYTLFEGSVGEHFSYSMSNHWLSTDPKSLYQNAFRSDDVDFIDWLTLSYNVGQFTFTLGKDMLAIGGYELDPMDVDQHPTLCSTFWHNCAIYQWSARVEYMTPDEASSVAFQFGTSPFGEYPFRSKLFSYSLIWYGEYGCFAPIWSANMVEYDRGVFVKMASLGNGFYFGDVAIEADVMYKHLNYDGHNHELSAVCKVGYTFADKVEVFAKGGYEYRSGIDIFGYDAEDEWSFIPTDASAKGYAFYGGGVNYYPLRNSKDLRLHAVVGANNYAKSVALSIGATYHFNLTETIGKRR